MKTEIRTEILIEAAPARIWGILTNFTDYPAWNPFIKSIEGKVEVGNKISVHIAPPEGNKMNFKPKVLSFEANKELSGLDNFYFQECLMGSIIFN